MERLERPEDAKEQKTTKGRNGKEGMRGDEGGDSYSWRGRDEDGYEEIIEYRVGGLE